MLQDLRFAIRLIVKERWYAAVAVVVVALGIGVNATGFTIVNAAFFRGPAFTDSDRLYMLSWQTRRGQRSNISNAELQDWRSESRAFSGIAAFDDITMNISDDRAMPEQVEAAQLTANAFDVLQQQPLIGRNFAPGEDLKGAEGVVILGYRLWQNRYGGDPNILGTSVRINGGAATIIGVMPDKMNFPINSELWIPFIPTPEQEQRNARALKPFGRLRDDASRRQAQTELSGIAQRLAASYPELYENVIGARVETITERFVGGRARVIFPVVMGAAGFVLLIACANVANLLLSRSAHRAREIAVRTALGASRWRILRQLLLESVLLGCIGGAAGLALAFAGARAVDAAVTDPGKPYWIVFTMDYVVLGYVAGTCLLTGILFGLAPALHISKTNLNDALKSGRGNFGSRRTRWFSGTMVVVELALTIVLLVGAGLMMRSFLNLYNIDIGIRTENLMAMRLQLPVSKYATPGARRAFFETLEAHLSAIPGAQEIAITSHVPPFGSGYQTFEIEGRPPRAPNEEARGVAAVTINPRFFEVLGVSFGRGRNFTDADGTAGSENVIINERLASMFFPGEDPLGKRLRFDRDVTWRTIVGISPSVRHGSTEDSEMAPAIYIPYRQDPPAAASVLVRSQLPPASVMDSVRREVRSIDRDQPVFTIETLDQMLEHNRWGIRLFGGIFAVFAVIALVLSSVGLYGVMAYAVTQRTQEIGVRMALGAGSREVSWLILKRGLTQLAIGLALGLAGAFVLSHLLQRILVQIEPTDPLTFVAITILLSSVAVAACLIPARRATRIDPLDAIRAE